MRVAVVRQHALAFTLIQEPSNLVTDTFTLQAQVQPIAGTIRSQIFGLRRAGSSKQVTQGWRPEARG